jgi:hypothetical protein
MKRVVIVFDGKAWFVRRVRLSVHDGDRSEMVYHCDKPIGTAHATIEDAAATAKLYVAPRKKPRKKAA